MQKFFFVAILFSFFSLGAQEKNLSSPLSPIELEKKLNARKPIDIGDMLRFVLKNNVAVHLEKLEIQKSDTEIQKDDSQYTPTIESGWQKQLTKRRYTNSFTTGDTVETNRLYLKAKKQFSTGTYFEVEIADNRIGSETIDNPTFRSFASSDVFSPSTLHTSDLSIVLRQELLKNTFGYASRKNTQIKQNQKHILQQERTYRLYSLVVGAMVDFWHFSVARENVNTAKRLLKNIRNVRSITVRKRRLGLSEKFEINQWNAFIFSAETHLVQTQLDKKEIRRNLMRTMNLSEKKVMAIRIRLRKNSFGEIDTKKDIERAYNTRLDYKALMLQIANAKKSLSIVENRLLPSISVGARYTSKGYDREYERALDQSIDKKYPDYSVDFKVEYPLWDKGVKVDIRNARIDLRKLRIQERQLRQQIQDEVYQNADQIQVSYQAFQNAKKTLKENRLFYNGLLRRYRQGRFSADTIKNALDTLVQSEQSYTEALVNYNIAIVRYDLVCNTIFTKYGIQSSINLLDP